MVVVVGEAEDVVAEVELLGVGAGTSGEVDSDGTVQNHCESEVF